jgi:phosphoserine phosphatase
MQDFDLDLLLKQIRQRRPKGRAVAAFDADGTLWNTDLGEALFAYQIKHQLVPLPPNAFEHYHHMKKEVSLKAAYLWLAQINKGVPIKTVRDWATKAVDEMQPIPFFKDQKRIISLLQELDVEIYIVTASIQWAVAPAAPLLKIAEDNVLGIETEVVNGVVTEKQKGLLTFREGKIKALLERTDGLAPFFSAGNTEGDQFLLEGSSDLRLVVAATPVGTENYVSERNMVAMAKDRGWFVQDHL